MGRSRDAPRISLKIRGASLDLPQNPNQLGGLGDENMAVFESLVVDLAVLAISGLSALGLGHLFLSVVVKDRRTSQ